MYAAFLRSERADHAEDNELASLGTQAIRMVWGTEWKGFRVARNLVGFLHAQNGLFIYNTEADHNFLATEKWARFDFGGEYTDAYQNYEK